MSGTINIKELKEAVREIELRQQNNPEGDHLDWALHILLSLAKTVIKLDGKMSKKIPNEVIRIEAPIKKCRYWKIIIDGAIEVVDTCEHCGTEEGQCNIRRIDV